MADTGSGFDATSHAARLRQQGYTIIPDFLSPQMLHAVREGLAPYLGSHQGRNNFEGHKTERVYTLVARGKVFEDIACDARVLALLDQFLKPGYLLTASQAICIHPGETPQPVHHDDGFYTIPRPRPAISLSTIVAVDAFTALNGGTEIIPGSHSWDDARVAGQYGGSRSTDSAENPEWLRQLRPVEMPAGACVVFLGTLLHRGGANRSEAPRLAFSNQYCEPWARPQENFYLGVPKEKVREMSREMQILLGYELRNPGSIMGQVGGYNPVKTLDPDFVLPVLR